MFDRDSRPTITELVVELADSVEESGDSTTGSGPYLARIGVWVRASSEVLALTITIPATSLYKGLL